MDKVKYLKIKALEIRKSLLSMIYKEKPDIRADHISTDILVALFL